MGGKGDEGGSQQQDQSSLMRQQQAQAQAAAAQTQQKAAAPVEEPVSTPPVLTLTDVSSPIPRPFVPPLTPNEDEDLADLMPINYQRAVNQ